MIKPICFKCRKELNNFGAVLLSPPFFSEMEESSFNEVYKFHLCKDCWAIVFDLIHQFPNKK